MDRAPEAVSTKMIAVEDGVGNIENLESVNTHEEAILALEEFLMSNNFEEMSVEAQKSMLWSLLTKLGETEEGTDVPLNNNNRYTAEVVAEKLREVIALQNYLASISPASDISISSH